MEQKMGGKDETKMKIYTIQKSHKIITSRSLNNLTLKKNKTKVFLLK